VFAHPPPPIDAVAAAAAFVPVAESIRRVGRGSARNEERDECGETSTPPLLELASTRRLAPYVKLFDRTP